MFFNCHETVFCKFLRNRFRRQSQRQTFINDFSLKYSLRSFKKCNALCSRLLKVGRDNSSKICPPLVVCVIEQALPLKAFPFIPCEHPFSVLSIIHNELHAQVSLTVLMADRPGCSWLTSDKVRLLGCTFVLFATLDIYSFNSATSLSISADYCALASSDWQKLSRTSWLYLLTSCINLLISCFVTFSLVFISLCKLSFCSLVLLMCLATLSSTLADRLVRSSLIDCISDLVSSLN
jgi:hypothetical protein